MELKSRLIEVENIKSITNFELLRSKPLKNKPPVYNLLSTSVVKIPQGTYGMLYNYDLRYTTLYTDSLGPCVALVGEVYLKNKIISNKKIGFF